MKNEIGQIGKDLDKIDFDKLFDSKILLIISISIFSIFASCKKEFRSPIQDILKEGNYNKVQTFVSDFYSNDNCIGLSDLSIRWNADYELANNYFVKEIYLNKDFECDTGQQIVIKLIREYDSIFYYHLEEKFGCKSSNYEIKDSFTDHIKLNQLKAKFTKDFGGNINVQELFKTEVYGFNCGGTEPIPTTFGIYADSLIKIKDKKAIFNLVGNPDPVKMLFGLYTIDKLCLKGILLDDREKLIIKNALQKEGKVPYCGGCIGGIANIQDEMKEFKCLVNYK